MLNAVVLLFVISAILEMLTLAWQPAKDATVPDMVQKPKHYTHAYSLLLIAAYATFPLSGAIFGLLAKVSELLGEATGSAALGSNPELLAFLLDSATFLISASLTLTLRIAPRPAKTERLNFAETRRELVDGLKFLFSHEMIRPWVMGIGGAFAGIGTFMSMAPFFLSDVLGGGSGSFGLLVATVGTGLGVGFLLAGPASQYFPKDVIFSAVVIAMGVCMVVFGSVSTLTTALIFAGLSGCFAGFAYPSGYALIQEKLAPHLRGRGSAAINSVVRLAIVGASAVAPALVKIIDRAAPGPVRVFDQSIEIRGIRVAMWLGGLLILFAGLVTTKAIGARRHQRPAGKGMFLVFEGGDGSGKTTQMELLRRHLEARGHNVMVTCEPGGTEIGRKIRDLLLDPANSGLSDKAEALLYAADRAQHVDECIRPALEDGAIVICDRYIDSSIAYQGLVRGLGADQIRAISRWGTGGLFPDMVFLLDYEASLGLERAGDEPDRIEMEGVDFHRRVREAYRLLAERHANRFQIIDGSKSPQEVAAAVRRKVELMLAIREEENPKVGAQAEAKLTS
jgi:dTMP kinase